MKILLISANTVNDPYPVYPLGLDYVAAAVSPRHEVKIADLNGLDSHKSLLDLVNGYDPGLIGLSLRNIDNTDAAAPVHYVEDYSALVRAIRRITKAPVVLGGSGFTIFPAELMAALGADFGIIGEGERLAGLVDAIEMGVDPQNLPGVIVNGGLAKAPPPLPMASERDPSSMDGHTGYYLKTGGMLNLQTKRGCCFRCIYCTYPHIEGRRMRLLAPESVARTALALKAAGARYLFITDSAFNADVDHSLAVARELRRVGLSIPWGAFFAPVDMPSSYFQEMAEAGLTHVEFGTESMSDRVLKAYRKPFERAQAIRAHRQALAAGVNVAHYFLLGGPGENADTLEETLEHIDGLERTVLFFFCGMRIYPHTALFRRAAAEGVVAEDQDLLSPVFYQSPEIHSDAIRRRVLAHRRGRMNWVVGSGGPGTRETLLRMYERGYTGPLWEFLVR
ncbi:MAG: lipid biosynthesis B12-binding/radical SAM protein [Desulfobacterales bacterium]